MLPDNYVLHSMYEFTHLLRLIRACLGSPGFCPPPLHVLKETWEEGQSRGTMTVDVRTEVNELPRLRCRVLITVQTFITGVRGEGWWGEGTCLQSMFFKCLPSALRGRAMPCTVWGLDQNDTASVLSSIKSKTWMDRVIYQGRVVQHCIYWYSSPSLHGVNRFKMQPR